MKIIISIVAFVILPPLIMIIAAPGDPMSGMGTMLFYVVSPLLLFLGLIFYALFNFSKIRNSHYRISPTHCVVFAVSMLISFFIYLLLINDVLPPEWGFGRVLLLLLISFFASITGQIVANFATRPRGSDPSTVKSGT